MRLTTPSLLCAGALLASIAAQAQPNVPTVQPTAKATFRDAKGQPVGSATLTQTPAGVLIDARLERIDPGAHAFHVHEAGRCDGPEFKTAGEHFSPGGKEHGYHAPKGPHAGDMPNQIAQPDGTLTFQVVNPNVSLDRGNGASLFDADGSALVLHAKPDDYKSQPSGEAGDRIACAVVERGEATEPRR